MSSAPGASPDLFLGLDVGGTKVAAGVVTAEGKVLSRVRERTPELRSGPETLPNLVHLGRQAIEAAGAGRVRGVGIGLPGPVDHRRLVMLAAPTIPEIEGVPLRPALQEAFGCPAAGDNDANGAALAESRFGAGQGFAQVVYFTISTGIGGGIVVDGQVLRGSRGTSAEFGHQVVLPAGGPRCDCGGHGCLEALASGRGIAARAREALLGDGGSPLLPDRITAETIADAARAGDPRARRVWDETALYLALGISNVINIMDPGIVVLGGGVASGAGDLLLDRIREEVVRRCMPGLARRCPIVPAALGEDVGIIGAACLALEAELLSAPQRNT